MAIHLISYATASHKHYQDQLLSQTHTYGIEHHIYNDTWLKTRPVYNANRRILDTPRGGGYWAWKPYIILDAMYRADDDDIIVYLDASTYLLENPIKCIEDNATDSLTAVQTCFPCWQWTKRDCFVSMGCDSEEYWQANQVWAGVIFVRVNDETEHIVKEWRDYCFDWDTVSDQPSKYPNFPGWVDHRHDQSILSNLVIEYKLKTFGTQLFMDR
jgi:hypothetical protein